MRIVPDRDEIHEIHQLYRNSTQMEDETGRLTFSGVPIMWSRVSLIYNLQVGMKELVGEAAFELMRSIAMRHGTEFYGVASSFLKRGGKEPTKENLIQFMVAETAAIGWGLIEVEIEDGRYIIEAQTGLPVGIEALHDKKRHDFAVDGYFLGYFIGFLSGIEKRFLHGHEVDCVAKGDPRCKMIIE